MPPTTDPLRTLGQTIRAARHGYGWLAGIGAFVRLTDHPDGFLVECIPPADVPAGRTRPGRVEHRVWWSTALGAAERRATNSLLTDVLRTILAPGQRRVVLRRPVAFVMDDTGRPVRSGPAPTG